MMKFNSNSIQKKSYVHSLRVLPVPNSQWIQAYALWPTCKQARGA